MQPLVSVIIPTFNRAHLLGETLDSILAQTYTHFECLVVDDGSTDHTAEILEFYSEKDSRIKYFSRPHDLPKGANACRNYGFEKSRGEFINWFDSDDLMTPDFLELKVNAIFSGNFDYVITKTECFDKEKNVVHRNENYYRFEDFPVTNYNYVSQKINWLTYDFFVKRDLAEKARFNEKLSAFQERNYFSKITCFSTNAKIVDAYVTKVRLHKNSIQANLKRNENLYYQDLRKFFFETWQDIKNIGPKESVEFLFNRSLDYSMHFLASPAVVSTLAGQFIKDRQFKSVFWYLMYQIAIRTTGKGHFFKKKVHKLR